MAVAQQANARRTRLQKVRRKWVKRYGRRSLRKIDQFLARESLVSNGPVFEASEFPWMREFENRWRGVRAEAEWVLAHRSQLPKIYEVAPDQKRIGGDDKWLSVVLYGYGYRSERVCDLCPETAKLLGIVPGLETAIFSILQPGAVIPRHRGISKGVIRCHLGLMVPEKREDCVISIVDVPHSWEEGKLLIFDDTHFHRVVNDTDQDRVVLLFDFHRPMKPLGRLVNHALLSVLQRTAVVQDAKRMTLDWERGFFGRD
jgi:beta-hydroxylase